MVIAALKNHRKRERENQLYYIYTKLLPVTSNVVKQFFSQVKLTYTYFQNCLQPSTLEIIMFLKLNVECGIHDKDDCENGFGKRFCNY